MNKKLSIAIISGFIILVAAVYAFISIKPPSSDKPKQNISQESASNPQKEITPLPTYTLDEIATHSGAESCWMAIEGSVYDVTSYANGHPGGEAILAGCGKDATEYYNNRGNEGPHSQRARDMLPEYLIGQLAGI